MSQEAHHTFPPRLIGLLVVLTLTWGFNWPMMKLAISGMAPMHFRTLCLLVGAAGLFAMAAAGRIEWRVPRAEWGRLVLIALFNLSGWNILAIYGVSMMDSGRAAILGYTMPVWSVLLAVWFLGERLTARRAAGVALGMAGMALLLSGEIRALQRAPLGALLMISAAISWAVGLVMIRKWAAHRPATSYSAWQMLVGVVPIVALALFVEEGSFNPFAIPLAAAIGVFYNLFVAFIFCHWAWMKIAQSAPAGVSSLASLMVPVVGVFSGALVLGETPRWTDYAALGLVVCSLATVLIPSRRV
jgi:drug/metabolite transporter (DMT)-like permease